MNIHDFADALVNAIQQGIPRADLKNEAEFELKHVIAPAWQLSLRHPEVRVFVHPQNRKERCTDACETSAGDPASRVEGFARCWAASKSWSVVDVLGTRNNFDLVAVDRRKKSLAVEVKWLSFSAGRGPNSGFQRFIGQCALAASVHDVVIGVCGFRGKRLRQFDEHEAMALATLKRIGVLLVPLRATET